MGRNCFSNVIKDKTVDGVSLARQTVCPDLAKFFHIGKI